MIDVTLFANWLEATSTSNNELANFYRARFRPEFAPAFEDWFASRPLKNSEAASSPFELPEYRLAAAEESQQLEREAGGLFQQGTVANTNSDRYVLNSVLLALVLFFSGLPSRFALSAIRAALLITALALLGIGLVNLLRYPLF